MLNVSTDKAVRDAANEGEVLIHQNSIARCLQNDLYCAIQEFDGIVSNTCTSFLEDRKKRGEKYDADIEKYIDDYLVSMKYFDLMEGS